MNVLPEIMRLISAYYQQKQGRCQCHQPLSDHLMELFDVQDLVVLLLSMKQEVLVVPWEYR